MSVHRARTTTTVWGTWDDQGELAPEPAVTITRYHGVIGLSQEGRELVIAYRDIPELLREIRACHKQGGPE